MSLRFVGGSLPRADGQHLSFIPEAGLHLEHGVSFLLIVNICLGTID